MKNFVRLDTNIPVDIQCKKNIMVGQQSLNFDTYKSTISVITIEAKHKHYKKRKADGTAL